MGDSAMTLIRKARSVGSMRFFYHNHQKLGWFHEARETLGVDGLLLPCAWRKYKARRDEFESIGEKTFWECRRAAFKSVWQDIKQPASNRWLTEKLLQPTGYKLFDFSNFAESKDWKVLADSKYSGHSEASLQLNHTKDGMVFSGFLSDSLSSRVDLNRDEEAEDNPNYILVRSPDESPYLNPLFFDGFRLRCRSDGGCYRLLLCCEDALYPDRDECLFVAFIEPMKSPEWQSIYINKEQLICIDKQTRDPYKKEDFANFQVKSVAIQVQRALPTRRHIKRQALLLAAGLNITPEELTASVDNDGNFLSQSLLSEPTATDSTEQLTTGENIQPTEDAITESDGSDSVTEVPTDTQLSEKIVVAKEKAEKLMMYRDTEGKPVLPEEYHVPQTRQDKSVSPAAKDDALPIGSITEPQMLSMPLKKRTEIHKTMQQYAKGAGEFYIELADLSIIRDWQKLERDLVDLKLDRPEEYENVLLYCKLRHVKKFRQQETKEDGAKVAQYVP
eukprot:156792_1